LSFEAVIYETDRSVAWLTLNRPSVLNAFNVRMRDELWEVLTAVEDDQEIRVLVIRGAGRAFCAGADLTEFGTAPSPIAGRRARFARDVWALLGNLRVPSIAMLHGFAFGSGLEMALLCDLRLAARDTLFAMPEVQLGLIPGAGGTQTLARVCGTGHALDLLLTGRRFDATEACRLGIVGEVVSGAQLASRVAHLAEHLAGLSPDAVRAVRLAVQQGADLTLDQGMQLEARLAAELRGNGPNPLADA
jgi:enoyl-CoA hydratase/carnithine racemase